MRTSTVLLAAVCLAFASCGKMRNTLVVTNHSGVTAEHVVVTVCGKDYTFNKIRNGATAEKAFSIRDESAFAVCALLEDGTTITNGFGSVAAGGSKGTRAEIELTEDKLIVGTQK